MSWKILYLFLGIACIAVGTWRLARGGSKIMVLTAVTWFFVILFMFFVPTVYKMTLIKGVPSLGRLLHYIVMPVLLLMSLYRIRTRH